MIGTQADDDGFSGTVPSEATVVGHGQRAGISSSDTGAQPMPRFRGAVQKAREMVADSARMVADSIKMAEDSARQAETNFDASLSASRKAVADSRILLQRSRLK